MTDDSSAVSGGGRSDTLADSWDLANELRGRGHRTGMVVCVELLLVLCWAGMMMMMMFTTAGVCIECEQSRGRSLAHTWGIVE